MPRPKNIPATLRHQVLVLGDHLDLQSSALQNFDPKQDVLWMAEVAQEYARLIYDPFPREVAHG